MGFLWGARVSAKRGSSLRMGCLTARGTPCFSRLSRTSGDIAPYQRLEWDAVCPAARGIGAGEAAVCPPESLWRPLCAGHGGGGAEPERGRQQVHGGTGCESRARRAVPTKQAGQGHRGGCPFPACPMGNGRPK